MSRRYRTAALILAALLIFGSYLAYTHVLANALRRQVQQQSIVYSIVQEGLAATREDAPLDALVRLQEQMQQLDIPIVVLNAQGEPGPVNNLPFVADLTTPEGKRAALEFAAELESRNPANKTVIPGSASIYYGDPPLLVWLRWVPYLQVGGGVMIVLITLMVVRADLRAQRERLYAAMAREAAHQMGTPLSSLAGWIEVLRLSPEERDSMASASHIASVISADVERLERVSRRFELIGQKPVLESVDVRAVVDELVGYFAPRLPRLGKGIRLRARVAPDTPPVRANRVLLVWALENVVKNAIDALSGRGGRITIAAHAGRDGMVDIHIGDDGPGVPPGLRDRIFDPGVTTKEGGWGVGLSLTRRIVQDLHRGRVGVRGRSSGGTIFDMAVPADAPAQGRS